ncbi:hypothetical protein [Bradyrhizobium sp. STM 3843]|uniref:hypothetical protein n=1 Tax=Bradyrhizobium sp. STM 3843 TaxID=551947 RepID=UPI001111EB59|nr:hypothetical protein [Bradyrhizobium sp. STM 3843]
MILIGIRFAGQKAEQIAGNLAFVGLRRLPQRAIACSRFAILHERRRIIGEDAGQEGQGAVLAGIDVERVQHDRARMDRQGLVGLPRELFSERGK